MSETIVVTDDTTRAEIAEAQEARARRLMAELARTPRTWLTRDECRRLAKEIDGALDARAAHDPSTCRTCGRTGDHCSGLVLDCCAMCSHGDER